MKIIDAETLARSWIEGRREIVIDAICVLDAPAAAWMAVQTVFMLHEHGDRGEFLKMLAARVSVKERAPRKDESVVFCRECSGTIYEDASPGVWLHDGVEDEKEGADVDAEHVAIPDVDAEEK